MPTEKTSESRRGPGRPSKDASPRLTRERILQAALRQIDENGIDSVGIRQLAAELGVAPNSLYSYVNGKDDLIHGAVRLAFDEFDLPDSSGPWRERVLGLCLWLRRRLLEHPNLVADPRFAEGAPFPFIPFPTNVGLILAEAGYTEKELIETVYAIFYHSVGFVTMEVSRARHGVPTQSDDFLVKQLDAEKYGSEVVTQAAAAVPLIRDMDLDAVFERATEALLAGLPDPAGVKPKK